MGILSRVSDGIVIRQLTDKDEAESEGISELVYDLMNYQADLVKPQFGNEYAKEIRDKTEECVEQLFDIIELKGGVFGAYSGDRLIGYIYGFITEPKSAYIAQIYVHEKFRGLRAGKSLIDEFTKWGLANGADCITLDVLADNSNARSTYRKLGFRDCAVLMRKAK